MANLIPAIDISSSALQAERTRMEVVASNIGNAEVTRGADGKPVHRKQVLFESTLDQTQAAMGQMVGGVKVSKIVDDQRPGQKVYMPGHPHADSKGFVTLPNINVIEETVDGMTASRSFQANLQVIKSARAMVTRSIGIAEA
jgi:flagellar basal-body rod protein FlgC